MLGGLPNYDAWKMNAPESDDGCAVCGESLEPGYDDSGEPVKVDAGVYVCSSECEARWRLEHGSEMVERLEALNELAQAPVIRLACRPFGTFVTILRVTATGRDKPGGTYYFERLDGAGYEVPAIYIDRMDVEP